MWSTSEINYDWLDKRQQWIYLKIKISPLKIVGLDLAAAKTLEMHEPTVIKNIITIIICDIINKVSKKFIKFVLH